MTAGAPGGAALSRLAGWAAAVAGLAVAGGWLIWGQAVAAAIPAPSEPAAAAIFYLVLFVPLLPLAGLLGLLCRLRAFRAGTAPVSWCLAGLLLGAAGVAAAAGCAWLNGLAAPAAAPAPGMPGLLLSGLGVGLVQVAGEEALVRGWLQPLLARLTGPFAGIVLASLAFAALHLAGGEVGWHALANMVLAGLFFGVLAWRSGGIVAPVAAHFAWNAVEDQGLGLLPNPGAGPFGALRDLDITGAALWGGGADGLNASVATTLVLAALILPFLVPPRAAVPAVPAVR
jgi:membrane protease YdiL (CAAX protease family)